VKHKDGEVVEKGPYYAVTDKVHGKKTISYSVPSEEVGRVQKEISNYKEFRALTEDYIGITQNLAQLECTPDDAKKN
jgi:hypothetical protein